MAEKLQRVLVLIPAYNEAGAIGKVIEGIKGSIRSIDHDVLVVDDGSLDETAIQVRAAGAMVVSLIENLGYGYALQTGYRVAMQGGYDIVVQMDGDGQHDPDSIKELLPPVLEGKADVVLGSRALSDVYYPMPWTRRVGQRVFSWILYLLSGMRIGDPTTGFQVLNRKALELYITDDFPGDYPDTDVLLFLKLRGLRVLELPATFRVNESGKSMHGGILKPMYYIYKMLFSMVLVYRRHQRWAKGMKR
jgi:glycosyltransferase involved in cell wall biosynthesis